MRSLLKCLVLAPIFLLPLAGQATFDFSQPVVLSSTEAPGTWYPDRYAPHAFFSPATAPDGTSIALEESIAGSDHQSYPSNAFYNTQGRKFDLPANTKSVTIKLFVPASWATLNGRAAGFWTTAYSPSASIFSSKNEPEDGIK